MANIGDLVATLSMDASQYQTGVQTAVNANKAVGGSIDQIIGKLQAQKKALENANVTTASNIAARAAEGADSAKVSAASALNEEVEALRKQKIETAQAAEAQEKARIMGERLVAALEKQRDTLGMNSTQLALYEAKQRGATAADIARAEALEREIEAMRKAGQVGAATAAMTGRAGTATTGLGNKTMLLTESVRAAEDAVAGFTNNGLKGMLMGVTNNVNQVGALVGGTKGLAISMASVAALIGVSVIPKIWEYYTGTEAAKQAEDRFRDAIDKSIESIRKKDLALMQSDHERARRERTFSQAGIGSMTSQQLESEKQRMQNQIQDMQMVMAENQAQADTLAAADVRVKNALPQAPIWTGEVKVGNEFGGVSIVETAEDFQRRTDDYNKLRARKEEYDKYIADNKSFQKDIAQITRQGKEVEKQIAGAKAKEKLQQQADEYYEEQAEARKHSDEMLAEAARRFEREKQIRQAGGNIVRDIIGEQSSYLSQQIADEAKKYEQRKKLQEAVSAGVITKEEYGRLDAMIGEGKKYAPGDAAGALQTGTTGAYSAIVKAMNQTRADSFEKQQAENAKDMIKLLEKIEAKDPLQVYTLS